MLIRTTEYPAIDPDTHRRPAQHRGHD